MAVEFVMCKFTNFLPILHLFRGIIVSVLLHYAAP